MSVGMFMAIARKRRSLSQSELAKRTGLDPSAISHFECGRRDPSVRNAIKIANALGCSLDELLLGGK